jgi:hypothetical protein
LRGKYVYGDEVEMLDETPSLAETFGPAWFKQWIVYKCTCDRKISKPINERQLSVKCDECDAVIRRKYGKWYRSL